MDKKFLVAVMLSIGTLWLVNTYWSKKATPEQAGVVAVGAAQEAVPGQPIRVPTSQDLYKPLEQDVVFADKKLSQEVVVDVETPYIKATLSSYGATLVSLDFKEHVGKAHKPLRTIHNKGAFEEEQRKKGCFLLALDQKTPYQYTLADKRVTGKTTEVVFRAEADTCSIEKTFVFNNENYQVDVHIALEPKGHAPVKPRLFFTAPFVGELEEDNATILTWSEPKETLEKVDMASTQGMAWFWTGNKPVFGAEDRYFVHALVNDPAKFVQRAFVKTVDAKNVFPVLEGPTLTAKSSWKLSFYMGPKVFDHLTGVDDRLEEVLSFGWLSWFCKLLLKLLSMIYDLVGNFGFAIILMTILLKLPFTPLSIYARKQMEIYQYYLPSINKIRTKFRHDLKMQHEELMKFYKDHKISPSTSFMGCLPLLIQMPILFSLYRVLGNYLDLYQAPFVGWIVDLSAKDPYYVMPILMGLSMMWQQKMTPVADDKQRMMMFFMAIVMTVVFANFPAGLVLYWLMNNLLTIAEDYVRKYFFA